MPRKPEPSFKLKQIIWDLAATTGAENLTTLRKDLDYELEKLRKNKSEDFTEDLPDIRKIQRIIRLDIQRLPPEVVASKLPSHVWRLRHDYEEIKELADSVKKEQEAPTGDLAEARVEQKAAQDLLDVATELKAQLSTPSPEFVLIDDLGSLGDNTCCLRQEGLIVVLENLSRSAGFKAASTTTTSGASLPTEIEVFWRVSSSGSIERYCPIERGPAFQRWLASIPTRLAQEFGSWKRSGGSYLADCRDTRMEINKQAKRNTPAGLVENLISILPRLSQPPPQPMTINFGNLVYQLAIEYCRSSGTRGLPDEGSYSTMTEDPPIFVKLVLGRARIHLATTLPGVAQNWAELHRKMIVEWGKSEKIGKLVGLFHDLQNIEDTIKKELN